MVFYRRRLREEIRALAAGKAPLQPAAYAPIPIPTYGSDTVIRLPVDPDGDDEAAMRALQVKVGDVYESADQIPGEARYEFLAEKLAELNT